MKWKEFLFGKTFKYKKDVVDGKYHFELSIKIGLLSIIAIIALIAGIIYII